jgi:hypothetical protein
MNGAVTRMDDGVEDTGGQKWNEHAEMGLKRKHRERSSQCLQAMEYEEWEVKMMK